MLSKSNNVQTGKATIQTIPYQEPAVTLRFRATLALSSIGTDGAAMTSPFLVTLFPKEFWDAYAVDCRLEVLKPLKEPTCDGKGPSPWFVPFVFYALGVSRVQVPQTRFPGHRSLIYPLATAGKKRDSDCQFA